MTASRRRPAATPSRGGQNQATQAALRPGARRTFDTESDDENLQSHEPAAQEDAIEDTSDAELADLLNPAVTSTVTQKTDAGDYFRSSLAIKRRHYKLAFRDHQLKHREIEIAEQTKAAIIALTATLQNGNSLPQRGRATSSRQLNKDADRLAFAIGGAASLYPAEGEDGTAVVAYMGFPNLQQANAARGCTEVADMRKLVLSRLAKPVRTDINASIKQTWLRTYREEVPSLIKIKEDGSEVQHKPTLTKLLSGAAYRKGIDTEGNADPYGSLSFRKLLLIAYASLVPPGYPGPDAEPPLGRIDFLGPGHIAYVETLVQLYISGGQEVPKEKTEDYEWFHNVHSQMLVQVPQRPDTAFLKLDTASLKEQVAEAFPTQD